MSLAASHIKGNVIHLLYEHYNPGEKKAQINIQFLTYNERDNIKSSKSMRLFVLREHLFLRLLHDLEMVYNITTCIIYILCYTTFIK